MKPMLAKNYDDQDPTGWWLSEKLDGVRAIWTGSEFISRNGNTFSAPDTFKAGLPSTPLDGELWLGRGQFQETVSRIKKAGSDWAGITFRVFDAPEAAGGFEDRLIAAGLAIAGAEFAEVVPHRVCVGADDLFNEFHKLTREGAEGLMLRAAGSKYCQGRSENLLKLKSHRTEEAEIVGLEEGKGRLKGFTGALVLRWKGETFRCGAGMSNDDRANPPGIGASVSFRFRGLTDSGIPRFPTFICARNYE
ncbi:MAG: DNA ligase [Yoonia sp.]